MTILLLGRHQELSAYRMRALESAGFRVLAPASKNDALSAIESNNFNVALLSYSLPDDTAQELAELIRQRCPQCPIVAIAEHGWDDTRLRPDEVVVGSEGPDALVEAIRRTSRSRMRRVK